MGSLYVGGKWCPQCGAEYRPEFSECADCRVPLITQQPRPRVQLAGDDARDHGVATYDLAGWSNDERAGLELLLRVGDIAHAWEDTQLMVAKARKDEVDALIEASGAEPVPDTELAALSGRDAEEVEEAGALAGPGRRLLGYFLDG